MGCCQIFKAVRLHASYKFSPHRWIDDDAQITATLSMGDPLKFVAETSGDLAKLVGYAEITDALNVSRSTIERAVKSGELPPPRKIKSRAVWLASDINAWARALFDGRLTCLANAAVTNPDDLGPEELSQKAIEMAALAISKHIGRAVDPERVVLSYRPAMSEQEDVLVLQRTILILASRFADFEEARSCIVAAWLFPALRYHFAWHDESMPELENLLSLATRAMDDDAWAALVNEVREAKANGSLPSQ